MRSEILQLLAIATLVACTFDEAAEPASPAAAPFAQALAALDSAAGYSVEVLDVRAYTLDTRTWALVLARVTRPDGQSTYVQWIPPDKPGLRPLVVVTAPYQVVDWSPEAIDARWSGYVTTASGTFLDRDGPAFDGVSQIYAERKLPQVNASEAIGHLLNDFGVLVVFGRFYAGGSVRDEVADMAAGMWLAPLLPQVEPTRIGVWGGSWGGFEALWAAQQAAFPLRAVAALYPPSDFPSMVAHAAAAQGQHAALFPPYLRRIYAATGGPPSHAGTDYAGLRTQDLCAKLPETLVLHDEGDTIVPVAQTRALAATCGVAPLYWPRATAGDPTVWTHGPLMDGPLPAAGLYSLTFLHTRLAPPEQPHLVELYSEASLEDHLRQVRAAQLAGRDVSYAVPRLYDLMHPKVWLWDITACATTGCPVEPGITVVGRLYARIWGPQAASAGAIARLTSGS